MHVGKKFCLNFNTHFWFCRQRWYGSTLFHTVPWSVPRHWFCYTAHSPGGYDIAPGHSSTIKEQKYLCLNTEFTLESGLHFPKELALNIQKNQIYKSSFLISYQLFSNLIQVKHTFKNKHFFNTNCYVSVYILHVMRLKKFTTLL